MKQLTFNILDHTFHIALSREDSRRFSVVVGDKTFEGTIEDEAGTSFLIAVEGVLFNIDISQEQKPGEFRATVNSWERIVATQTLTGKRSIGTVQKPELKTQVEPAKEEQKAPAGKVSGGILAPMPGRVVKVTVNVGDSIKAGDVVLILEAMKMENEICSNVSGTVKEIKVAAGDSVDSNDVMVVIG